MRLLPIRVRFARRLAPVAIAAAILALSVLLPFPVGSAANAESGAHRNPPPPPAVTVPGTSDLR